MSQVNLLPRFWLWRHPTSLGLPSVKITNVWKFEISNVAVSKETGSTITNQLFAVKAFELCLI